MNRRTFLAVASTALVGPLRGFATDRVFYTPGVAGNAAAA